jgi:hypothetical protein
MLVELLFDELLELSENEHPLRATSIDKIASDKKKRFSIVINIFQKINIKVFQFHP